MSFAHCQLFPNCMRISSMANEMPVCDSAGCPGAAARKAAHSFTATIFSAPDNAPPQPAATPAGVVTEAARMLRYGGYRAEPKIADALIAEFDRIDAELTRLRSAPPVTEEMGRRAEAGFDAACELGKSPNECWRAALAAALTPASGTQSGGEK